jgi:putative ABC transport system permease protein
MNGLNRLSYASRSLRRAPLFTVTVVMSLTVGIGSAAAIFAIVNGVLLRPLPYGHPDQLVGAWHNMPPLSMVHAEQTPGTYLTYKRFAHSLAGIGIYQEISASIENANGTGESERVAAAVTTADLLPLLEVSPLLGRTFTTVEDAPHGPNVAVISEGLWRSRFGASKSVIGQKLLIFGRSTEIIGVMPSRFRFPNSETQIWMPRQLDPNAEFLGGFSYGGVARLKPGVTIEAAQREMASVLPRMAEITPMLAPGVTTKMILDQAKPVPLLVPMREDIVGGAARTLWIVAVAAMLVLLVTCANVANLLLVRADARHRELSVRSALGASRRSVMMHFFTETAALAGISSVLGLFAAFAAVRLLVALGPADIPRLAEIRVDATVVGFTLLVASLVAQVCSAIPAIRFMRSDTLTGLRDGGRGGTAGSSRQRARSALVAMQMALALVVLVASGLLLRTFQRLHAVRPGFNPDGVAALWVSAPGLKYPNDTVVARFYQQLVERTSKIPGATAVGITSHLPLQANGGDHDPFYVEGDATYATKIPPLETYVSADSGYFRAMQIPLITGRMFDRLDRQNGREAIISLATAIHYFHDSTGRAAIGKRFHILPSGEPNTIIGVVGDVRDTSLMTPADRSVYFPEAATNDTLNGPVHRTMALVARTSGDPITLTREMQRVTHELDPSLPTFHMRTMRQVTEASIARLSFTMMVLGVAAGVTLILGVVGLYGVIAYIVTLRTRELGVRIALGAQPRLVAAMVMRQGLILSATGIVVGLALVALVGRFLRSLLYEVTASDPRTLTLAAATLLAFALLASWIPARRAARVDPMEALRAD